MAVWGENWSSGSDTDESGSSYHSDDSSNSSRMESARILGETFHFPQGLCDNPEVFKEVLSIDTWNNFTVEQRQHLENFLPSFPENDEEEKEKTLGMLFNRENIKFGNPLTDFHNQLQSAYFRPDLARMRSLLRKAQYKDYKRAERWRIFELLKSVLSSRQRLVDAVINGEKTKPCPPPSKKPRTSQLSQNVKNRYFQELALIRGEVGESELSSEDESYPGGPSLGTTKKLRRTSNVAELLESDSATPVLGTLCTGPNPWDPSGKPQHNPYAHPEQSYAQILAQHTKRRTNREDHPDLHTEGITLQDVAMRCKFLKKPTSKPIVQRKIKMKIARSLSVSSPAVEEEIDEVTDVEEPSIKQEDEEESKVDIEALDELPLPPVTILHKPHSSSSSHNHGSSSKHHSSSSSNSKIASLLLNRKIKLEHPEPLPPVKKSVSIFEPEFKKSRSDSTESRKSKTSDSVDSLIKKIKLEPESPSPKKVKVEPVEIPLSTIKVEPPSTPITPVTPVTPLIPSPSSSTQQTVVSSQATIFSTSPVKMTPSTRILTPATLSDLDGYNMMDLPIDFDETPSVDLEDIKPHPELMQETHACFFSLIRDVLLSTPDHRIEMKELELRVKAWASSPIGPINQWYTPQLESQLASAVLFLAGDLTEALPDDYVPYMEWKSNVGAYQWIGAGRDSDHRLSVLCSLWLDRGADRGGPVTTAAVTITTTITTTTAAITTTTTSNATTQVVITPDPPPRGPAVRPTSPRKRELFRLQEKQRYEFPYKAFSYNVGGSESTVGPVRSMQTGNLSKARGHTLLVEDRPKHVTILELVRDAVARLPNAQGTRADIVTLLKDSQYLADSAPEGMLSSVVSSALDRLHYEHDPIVKYDTKRKIWMYLHKGRSTDEHERMHALGADVKPTRPKSARKPPKPKKESAPKTATATVSTNVDPNVIAEVPVSVTDSSTSTTTSTVAVTSGNVPVVPSSPLLVQAKPKTTLKTTTVASATKKVTAEGVKTMLGKTKLKLQESPTALTAQQQLARLQAASSLTQTSTVATSPKKTVELTKTAPTSIVPSRSVLHEATSVSASTVKSQTPTMTKKVGNQTVTLSAEQPGKQTGKSIVKVITSQGSSQSVKTVQRLNQQVSQQQILQLKQQLMAESPNLLQKGQLKKPGGTGAQQLLVRMQGDQGSGGQGQVIVINQQQILVDSPQLAQQLKQQPKQLQQFLSKQQIQQVQQVDSQVQQSSAQTTQTSGTVNTVQKVTPQQQQQLNQIILNKQQQILIGDQQKGGKGQSQMILMKQQGTSVSSADGSKPQVQQMILAVKPGTDGEGTQITPQQLHQMIVLNKQQNQQQIYMVKPDQKSLQVITQQPLKGQTQQLTLAQIQQLQQQQQRSAGTSTILNTSRVVAQVSSASVNTAASALFKPQVVTGSSGTQMVAKVVTSSQTPVLTMENILAQHKQQSATQQAGVRLPTVSRALTSQYVVSLPQTRVVQTTVQQVVATTSATGVMTVTSMGNAEAGKIATTQGVRIPGLNLANIAGKQVLLASKPHGGGVQGQNVLLGNAGGQALLVGGNQQGTVTVLQQGSQQILLPPGVVKTIQGLKVIPLAQGKPNQAQPGRHQMIARISGMRPVLATNIVQEAVPTSQTQQTVQLTQPTSSTQSKD